MLPFVSRIGGLNNDLLPVVALLKGKSLQWFVSRPFYGFPFQIEFGTMTRTNQFAVFYLTNSTSQMGAMGRKYFDMLFLVYHDIIAIKRN